MTFLNPAVLFGMLAAAIPVLIHLLNLRRLKKIEFSTLAFLKELQKNKISKIKIKQWLLLALRTAAIACLVLSFARPALRGISIGGATSAAKTSAVIILDDSYSMSVTGSKGSYFNVAKQTAKNLLNNFQEGDEISLVKVSGLGGLKATRDIFTVRKAIDDAGISYISSTLDNALIRAGEILNESKNFNKEIYILSDGQKSRMSETITAGTGSQRDLSHLFNDKIKIYNFDLNKKEPFNLSINSLEANNQIFEKDKPVSFTAEIKNNTAKPAVNSVVSLFVNGQRAAQQSISLGGGETKKIILETTVKSAGYNDVMAELEDDDVLLDNKRFMSFSIPEKISVLLLTDYPDDAMFAAAALEGAQQENIKITEKSLSELPAISINSYDAAIVIGSETAARPEILSGYLRSGNGIMLMPGARSTLWKFKSLLSSLGLPAPISEAGIAGTNKSVQSFDKTDFSHPLFSNVFESGSKKETESPEIYHTFIINSRGQGKDIITLQGGSAFLTDYIAGKGHALVFSSAPLPSWSNFTFRALFPALMLKSVYYLAAKDNLADSYLAGETVPLNISKAKLRQVTVSKPGATSDYINTEKEFKSEYINYSSAEVAGNYKVYSGHDMIGYFAVNTDPAESQLDYISAKEFEVRLQKMNYKGKLISLKEEGDYSKIIAQARFGSELWRHFLLLALILALTEMAVARNRKGKV
jgi:hypothetical protein